MAHSDFDAVLDSDLAPVQPLKAWSAPAVILAETKNAESGSGSFASDFVYLGNAYSS